MEVSQFRDIKTLAALNGIADQTLLTAFVKTDGFYKLVLAEMFIWLGTMVFGTDMVGENAYYCLRYLIQDYKVNPNQGIQEWADEVKVLLIYIPFIPSKALERRGAEKQTFTEFEMQEILDNNLPRNYLDELTSKEYNIYEQPFSRTIDWLEAAEPALKATAAVAKEMNDLKDKVHGGGKAC